MIRRYPIKHAAFRRKSLAHSSEATEMIERKHDEMQQQCADLDQGWEDLRKNMSEVGLSMTSTMLPDAVLFNVGGVDLHVPRSFLEEMQDTPAARTLGGLFESGVWDERLPRDSDANVVLDESPLCVEYLINELSKKSGILEAGPGLGTKGLPADELQYLPHVAGALGLSSQPMAGRSTVLEASELGPLSVTILDWCPGEPEGLEPLYRASRDGWTPTAFHTKCDGLGSTVTVVRVQAQDHETTDSIVGGFSSVPWSCSGSWTGSPGAFVFMLRDGVSTQGKIQPTRWNFNGGSNNHVLHSHTNGPGFGAGMLHAPFQGSEPRKLYVRQDNGVPSGSPFLALHGRFMVELEVFRVCPKAPTPPTVVQLPNPPPRDVGAGLIDCSAIFDAAPMPTEEHEDNVHRFGVSIAESLKAERTALHHAQTELEKASAKAASARDALAAIYGPGVAAGKKDPVVELSVRGPRATARITTLLSTLQTCPDSALARRFNETWTEREDPHGRPVIKDCTPAVFSKVLDVLRMKKRAAWAGSIGGHGGAPMARVAVNAADRDAFLGYVNMYFVGCESFITDHIEFLEH